MRATDMLVDEEDGNVAPLCVLGERGFDRRDLSFCAAIKDGESASIVRSDLDASEAGCRRP